MKLLHDLPLEIIECIFSYLDDFQSGIALSLTCKAWLSIFYNDREGYLLRHLTNSESSFLRPCLADKFNSLRHGGASCWWYCLVRYKNTMDTLHNVQPAYGADSVVRNVPVNKIPRWFDTAVSLVMDGDPKTLPFIPTFDIGKKSIRGRALNNSVAYRVCMTRETFEVFGPDEVLPLRTGTSFEKRSNQEFYTIFECDDLTSDRRVVIVRTRLDRFKALLLEGSQIVRQLKLGYETRLNNPIFAFSGGTLFMCDDGRMYIFDMLKNEKIAYRQIDYKGNVSSLAVTQTHMWLVNAYAENVRGLYAISLDRLIDPTIGNETVALDEWTHVMDINFPSSYDQLWKFGTFRFYGSFVGLVRGKTCLTIDLIRKQARYYQLPDHCMEGRWVLDASGSPVYLEQWYLDDLASNYLSKGLSGRVHFSEIDDRRQVPDARI